MPGTQISYAHDILSHIYVGTTTSNLDHMPTTFVNLQCSKEKPTCLAYKYINIYTYVRDMLAYLCMCRLLSLLTHIICKWTQYVVLGDMNLEQSSL